MATAGLPLWSTTAATNANADPAANFAEGMAPSALNDSIRAAMASVAKWRDDLYGITAGLSTGGTATAFTVSTNSTYATAAVMSGAIFTIIPHTDSGAAPTLAVDGLTARALNSATGVAIETGSLKSGTPYFVRYKHSSTEFLVIGRAFVGSALKVVNDLTEDTSPDGANDFLLSYDASASAAKKVKPQSLPVVLPRGYIDGCTLSNNGSDATNDIDIAAGSCRDSTNSVNITVAAMTGKQLDANWAPGGSAGMRYSGAGIANTIYYIYAVAKADGTQDIYADPSATIATVLTHLQAETGGANYIYARYIGAIIRESAAIVPFTQKRNIFQRKSHVILGSGSANTYSTTSPTLGNASLTNFIPSTASRIHVLATTNYQNGAAANVLVAPATTWGGTNNGPLGSNGVIYPIWLTGNNVSVSAWLVLESTNIAWASGAAGGAIACLGWEDNRGQDA